MDFIKLHEAENFVNAGNRLQQIEGMGIVVLGGFQDIEFEVFESLIVIGDQAQVDLDGLLYSCIVKALGDPLAVGLVSDFLANLGQVILVVGRLHMRPEFRAFAHQVGAAPEPVAGGAHLGWVDIGLW